MTLATDQNSRERGLSAKALQFMSLRDDVMDCWERETRSRIEGARDLLSPVLTDTLPAFFDNIAEALSPLHPRQHAASGNNSPTAHGSERARMTSFGPDQIIHEYQIFCEALASLAHGRVLLDQTEWAIVDRFINEAMREAVKAFMDIHAELRRKVAAALSHDMRTPLAVIGYGTQLIALAPGGDAARSAAAKIEANASRLKTMMGDLVDSLTFQDGATIPLRLTTFDMLELIEEIREQYALRPDLPLGLDVEGERVVGHRCEGTMRRAVENLINNAIKYGDGKGISIACRHARGRLMLTVHNEGEPIPKERHNRIFDDLRREESNAAIEGWGIGLPFVKAMAEAHGGTVSVDSSAPLGTTFLIDVPVDCRPFVGTPHREALEAV